jgi:hypothetical protein
MSKRILLVPGLIAARLSLPGLARAIRRAENAESSVGCC